MTRAIQVCLHKYVDFNGRARRAEFWWFTLAIALGGLVFRSGDHILSSDESTGFGFLSSIFGLAVLAPSLAVGARRLHDIGRTGWWQLIALVPIIGWIVLIVFFATKGDTGGNTYGSDPLA